MPMFKRILDLINVSLSKHHEENGKIVNVLGVVYPSHAI